MALVLKAGCANSGLSQNMLRSYGTFGFGGNNGTSTKLVFQSSDLADFPTPY